MGSDPETSVVNEWGQAWEAPNLYIMDGSVLPTGGAVNPTSTIGAVALRNASHLRDRFGEAIEGRRTREGPLSSAEPDRTGASERDPMSSG
jgi:2-methyl-1,2-propanediol dehydrogenase